MLKLGDKVVIINCAEAKFHTGVYDVVSEPWDCGGTQLIKIEINGQNKSYDIDCLKKVDL